MQEADSPNVEFLPIRSVSVIDAYIDQTTGLVHVSLKLGDFITCTGLPSQEDKGLTHLIPPYQFVYHLEHQNWSSTNCQWHEKIAELIAFDKIFANRLFFNLNIRGYGPFAFPTVIEFDRQEKCSAFKFTEDKHYILELAIYNSSVEAKDYGSHILKFNYNEENVFISNPENISIGADKDNRAYRIVTKEMKSNKSSAYIKFQSIFISDSGESIQFEEIIRLDIKRNWFKIRIQLMLSIFSFLGSVSSVYGATQLKPDGNWAPLFLLIGLVLLVISSSGQYIFFRKN